MNDRPIPPKVFANHLLKQMIEHMLGEDIIITAEDYQTLRIAFRNGGGLWGEVVHGNIVHLTLISKLVGAWGQMPERKRTGDQVT